MTSDPSAQRRESAYDPVATPDRARQQATYNAATLRRLALQTQAQATTALIGGIVAGVVTGLLFGYAATLMFAVSYSLILPGAMVGGVLGIAVGRRKAQALKFQAQMALCQVQIEENTRRT
jgi:F0F1-type ATP synthase assembly protein I